MPIKWLGCAVYITTYGREKSLDLLLLIVQIILVRICICRGGKTSLLFYFSLLKKFIVALNVSIFLSNQKVNTILKINLEEDFIIDNLTEKLMAGAITVSEVKEIFRNKNINTLKLKNGFTIHYRKDADYIWVSGNENDEGFEIGLRLFLTINKTY